MKKTSNILYFAMALLLSSALSYPALAEDTKPMDADNSGVNVRDRDAAEPTADNGGNKKSDREIMSDIRKAVTGDKSLSTYAHNIKIVSMDGKVTLKGPVRSQEEIQKIQEKAAQTVGAANVTNELSVKTKH